MKKTPPSSPALECRRRARRRDVDVLLPNFQDLIDNAVQGILVHRNFRPLYANDAFAKVFGYDSAKAIMALPLVRPLVPDDLWPKVEADYDALMRGGTRVATTRMRGKCADGTEIWLSVTERVIDWHGVSAVQINVFDISESVEVEQSLVDSEHHLRAMLEILPIPIYITRWDDGQVLFVNRKTCLLFQRGAGALLRSNSSTFFTDPLERAYLREIIEAVRDVREVEVQMRAADGHEFTAELAAILMEYGGIKAALVAFNDVSQRKQLQAELLQQANTDVLTGISNRRHFLAQAEQEERRAARFGRPLSLMMIDVDHFKKINDRLGHAAGDSILQNVVKAAMESLRQSDVMGRLGGEEFAVLLPETDLAAAADVARRLCAHVAERPLDAGETFVSCSVSVGVAQFGPEDQNIDALLRRADDALYRAKKSGRNCVEIAGG